MSANRASAADIAKASLGALFARPLRSALTAASMAAAVASVILVATVAATGSDFVISQIEGVGANLVYAYYEAGGNVSPAEADYIDLADVDAVRARLGSAAAAVAGVMTSWDTVSVNGQPVQIRVLGSTAEYRRVRNLTVRAGRFLDRSDLESRSKVCLVTPQLARRLFGPRERAVGRSLRIHGLDFRIVGEFSEGVATFGQSEFSENSVLVPLSVLRYFQRVERVDPLYVSVRSGDRVEEAAGVIRGILEERHRPGSSYRVQTLSSILEMARRILSAMSVAMTLVASITLAVSGVFIMNMMLIGVAERTSEIGIRMAVGATRRDIRAQFLLEAIAIAAAGGVAGTLVGAGLAWAAPQVWPALEVRVPGAWVAFALAVPAAAGCAFGLVPAVRASRMDPAEALRNE